MAGDRRKIHQHPQDDQADVSDVRLDPDTREPQIVTFLRARSEYQVLDPSVAGHLTALEALRLSLDELKDDDEDDKFLKEGWIEAPVFLESYVESQDRDWTARQVWGFALVESGGQEVKKYVRRAIIKKKDGKDFKRARLVYDYKEPLKN